MFARTQRSTFVFSKPFTVNRSPRPMPVGTYLVETEEELVGGLSFSAYRRVAMTITLQPVPAGTLLQASSVEPDDLARAHTADGA